MSTIFCVEFQRVPLKFHTKYLTQTLKDVLFIDMWKFASFYIYELLSVFEMLPRIFEEHLISGLHTQPIVSIYRKLWWNRTLQCFKISSATKLLLLDRLTDWKQVC